MHTGFIEYAYTIEGDFKSHKKVSLRYTYFPYLLSIISHMTTIVQQMDICLHATVSIIHSVP